MNHPVSSEQPSSKRERFALCATAIVKNEASYIEEWLAYHRAVGVGHFFVFDNNSSDAIDAVLAPWINHGVVILLKWPLFGGQIDAYNFALRHFGHVTEWMAFIDIDEFIVPKRHQTIPAFLGTLPDADQLLIPWRNFHYSGHEERPAGFVMEAYTRAQDIPAGGFTAIGSKAVVRPAAVVRFVCHYGVTEAQKTVNERGELIAEMHQVDAPTFDQIQLNHYYTKSYAEMQAKVLRGQSDGGAEKTVPSFNQPGFNTVDEAILDRVGQARAVLDDIHRLVPSPFRYGARRGLEDFTRRDMMPWLQRHALSNYINRTPRLQIKIPLDLKNLATGRVLLVRGDDHGVAAEPCGLERCIHVRDMLRRLQATTIWSLGTGALAGVSSRNIALAPSDGALTMELRGSESSMSFATPREVSRCYSVAFALKAPESCELLLSLQAAPGDEARDFARAVALPNGGTYLGVVEINHEPQPATGLTLTFKSAASMGIELRDFVAFAYG